jgi:Ni/Co efflux regulator RcnB
MLAIGPAIADKPSWAGGGNSDKGNHQDKSNNQKSERQDGEQRSRHEGGGPQVKSNEYFGDRHRTIVHEYYSEQFRSGHCPPGLAKKNNGCMPPGQARKWTVGRPLPRDVIYYEVPQPLLVQFDRAPAGYRYVRVDSDILLLALGTGMVIDAIQNLGRM